MKTSTTLILLSLIAVVVTGCETTGATKYVVVKKYVHTTTQAAAPAVTPCPGCVVVPPCNVCGN